MFHRQRSDASGDGGGAWLVVWRHLVSDRILGAAYACRPAVRGDGAQRRRLPGGGAARRRPLPRDAAARRRRVRRGATHARQDRTRRDGVAGVGRRLDLQPVGLPRLRQLSDARHDGHATRVRRLQGAGGTLRVRVRVGDGGDGGRLRRRRRRRPLRPARDPRQLREGLGRALHAAVRHVVPVLGGGAAAGGHVTATSPVTRRSTPATRRHRRRVGDATLTTSRRSAWTPAAAAAR